MNGVLAILLVIYISLIAFATIARFALIGRRKSTRLFYTLGEAIAGLVVNGAIMALLIIITVNLFGGIN